MFRTRCGLFALTAWLLIVGLGCLAQAQVPVTGAGKETPAAPAGYSGPGDVTSFTAWWGLRAYSAATRGNNVADICTTIATVDTCVTVTSDASTGNAVIVTIGGLSCSAVTCNVKTLYDQTGNTNCGGSACNLTQATIAKRPTLTINAFGSLPGMTFASNVLIKNSAGLTQSQPFSLSFVTSRASATGNGGATFTSPDNAALNVFTFFRSVADAVGAFAGAQLNATVLDGASHAIQEVYNGASSSVAVDGSTTTGDTGTNTLSGAIGINDDVASDTFVVAELGTHSGAFSGGNISSLNSNQHSYWGF